VVVRLAAIIHRLISHGVPTGCTAKSDQHSSDGSSWDLCLHEFGRKHHPTEMPQPARGANSKNSLWCVAQKRPCQLFFFSGPSAAPALAGSAAGVLTAGTAEDRAPIEIHEFRWRCAWSKPVVGER